MNKIPITILLVDDDEDDRIFFEEAIKALSVNTLLTHSEDGMQMMNYLFNLENNSKELPDIIFLDLNMPGRGGLHYLDEIKKHPTLKSISIAIYSTSSSEKDIEESFIKGANIYIHKPNNFNDLKEVLQKVICTNWQYINDGHNKESFLLNL